MIRLFRPAFNDKVVIARCPVQYWQIFSSFLIFCCYFTLLKAREISCKIWETRRIFPILHSAPCDNNYIYHILSHISCLSQMIKMTKKMERSIPPYMLLLSISIIKTLKKLWNMFKVNNKYTRTRSTTSFWCIYG